MFESLSVTGSTPDTSRFGPVSHPPRGEISSNFSHVETIDFASRDSVDGCHVPLSCSVALATYNGQRFLQAQLDSIAAQSALPAELVIADDGSADETLRIVRSFAESVP